jgi:cell division septation protein DedD
LETHPVGPASGGASEEAVGVAKTDHRATAKPIAATENPDDQGQAPLGTPKPKNKAKVAAKQPEAMPVSNAADEYTPQTGQMFLQVVALARDDAYGVANVLTKEGFRAHSVPKPGSAGKVYRVLVGPIRDTAELSTTRDALRKNAGFQNVIVQRY